MHLGWALSSEEHAPRRLVEQAVAAENAGFGFALISDHFHPWVDRQGQSPFVWSVLGAIATSTEEIVVGTGVTCPTTRIHPAIVAQAAATTANMFGDRFFLGVGAGENLNEHVLGDRWVPPDLRREQLEEAVEVIRQLWTGELTTHRGRHYTVEGARLYTVPERTTPIMVAAGGPEMAALAARIGDGLIVTTPDEETISSYRDAGGGGPLIGQLSVCVADSEDDALDTVREWWPNAGLKGTLSQELPLPSHFEAASVMVGDDALRESVVCGADVDAHARALASFGDAGVDHVYVHQIGPRVLEAIEFYASEVMPSVGAERGSALRQGVAA